MTSIDEINSQIIYELKRHMTEPCNMETSIEGVTSARRDEPTKIVRTFYKPSVILMAQGQKTVNVGGKDYNYGKNQCLSVAVDVPVVSRILEASPEKPCMTVAVEIDKFLVSQISAEIPAVKHVNQCSALMTADADLELMDAFLRLVKLFHRKEEIPVMASLIIREIHYRLLKSPLGGLIRNLNTLGTNPNRIADALAWLRSNFKETLYVDQLADRANMATSTFHRCFKEITAYTPVQYQKRLRLHEAQRLIFAEEMNVTGAAYEVGYESFTQFNREYKRMFGEPPRRDVTRLCMADKSA